MDCFNEDGIPFWLIGGTKRRIAAYLWFNVPVGDVFTMAQVREAIEKEQQTQTDRRLRELREQGWEVTGYKDDGTLKPNSYRLEKRGKKLWLGESTQRDTVSNKIRRQVFERDNNTCVVCGIYAGDPYPDATHQTARMTIGHRIPNQRLGEATLKNLQTECARCNETIRNLLDDPETIDSLKPIIFSLSAEELKTLDNWLERGARKPSNIDMIFSKIRKLSTVEQNLLKDIIKSTITNLES